MFVFGNWKMNGNIELINQFSRYEYNDQNQSIVSVLLPSIYISYAKRTLNIDVGAQDVSCHDKGAFTGSISASMLKEFDLQWCCVGHSERRAMQKETSNEVVEKALRLDENKISPILCVGESLQDREGGQAYDVVRSQLEPLLKNRALSSLVIAYEPVWAIGTGKVASIEDVSSMHSFIKEFLNNYLANGKSVPIIYGGSVKADNAEMLIRIKDVDGFLIGGASLTPESFYEVVNICNNYCSSSIR